MAVSIMRGEPARVDSPDVLTGTAAALAAGTHAYIGYSGTVQVEQCRQDGDALTGTVVHTLDTCSYPNWVGTEQRRVFRLEGQRLTLTTPAIQRAGVLATAVLVWERVSSPEP